MDRKLMAEFGAKDWAAYYQFTQEIFQACYPHRDLVEFENFRKNPRPLTPIISAADGFVIRKSGRIIGCCHTKYNAEHHVLLAESKFLEPDFEAAAALSVVDELKADLRRRQGKVLQMVVENQKVRDWYTQAGLFEKVGQVNEYVLPIVAIPPAVMQAWLQPADRFQFFRLDWTDAPAVDRFLEIYNSTIVDVPDQNVVGVSRTRDSAYFDKLRQKNKEQGLLLTAYCMEQNGRLVGIGLFENRIDQPRQSAIQYTGIAKDFRKQSLGRCLKARSVQLLQEDFPTVEYIVTGTEESNTPMQNINNDMGFQHRVTLTMLRFIGD